MFRPTDDCVYVRDQKSTYCLRGNPPFSPKTVAPYPAVEGTDLEISGSLIGNGEVSSMVGIWASKEGICIGAPGGLFMNLTQGRLDYPSA